MKGRLIALLGICICIAILIVSGPGAQGKKPDKPVKPGITEIEWITFDGDLIGAQKVEGLCCVPGRYPEYKMGFENGILAEKFGVDPFSIGGEEVEGHLWINTYGTGRNREYIVHFWTEDFGIEIIGGVIDYDRKNKKETVTFMGEECVDLFTLDFIDWVSFTLVREPY